ncbi:alpha-L-fucosidase [Pontiella agarivorans]|uniref:alpha-L-fucosidase n=1 Tax=Pontiella agarivorans TaxID=3038953 RepID=A0ABU5MY84_9BACT|nr:alpha-L-fucosidase [Pontiella agarivorans]MDZ8119130.1 alpha-L-fucosidase [Pontiella agarivorans]
MNRFLFKLAICGCGIAIAGSAEAKMVTSPDGKVSLEIANGPFDPTPESLSKMEIPEWFKDAKFGIYAHWNPQSVVEKNNGWYARNMYIEGDPAYKTHLEKYGHPSEFGYKDIIPLFTAEKFNGEEWIKLWKSAGAKYAIGLATHHDNFDMWDSKYNRWNSVNMGPKKDIMAALRDAAEKEGMVFGVTTHLERTWSWLQTNKRADTEGPKKGVPYDGNNPDYQDFYLPPDPNGDDNRQHPKNAPVEWRINWANRMIDLIDHYAPEHMYVDGAIPFRGDDQGFTGLAVIAHHYNRSIQRNGKLTGVFCAKKQAPSHGYWWDGVVTQDFERGRANEIQKDYWQTDTSIGKWFWSGDKHRPASVVIHEFIDIVSKNGNVLLNVPPRGDGSFDANAVALLTEMGAWLQREGDGIYGTRHWLIHGEGPNTFVGGGSFQKDITYTSKDVRYTRSKDGKNIYAHILGWDEDEDEICLQSFAPGYAGGDMKVKSVSLLSTGENLTFRKTARGLEITKPVEQPGPYAYGLKIETADYSKKYAETPYDAFSKRVVQHDADIPLKVFTAQIKGEGARLPWIRRHGGVLDSWSDERAFLEWDVVVTQSGAYVPELIYEDCEDSAHAVLQFSRKSVEGVSDAVLAGDDKGLDEDEGWDIVTEVPVVFSPAEPGQLVTVLMDQAALQVTAGTYRIRLIPDQENVWKAVGFKELHLKNNTDV